MPPKLDALRALSAYALYIPALITEVLLRLAYLRLFRLALGSPFALCLYTVISPPTALCNSFKALLLFVIGLYGYYNAKKFFCQYFFENFIKFIKRVSFLCLFSFFYSAWRGTLGAAKNHGRLFTKFVSANFVNRNVCLAFWVEILSYFCPLTYPLRLVPRHLHLGGDGSVAD